MDQMIQVDWPNFLSILNSMSIDGKQISWSHLNDAIRNILTEKHVATKKLEIPNQNR
jgi:hypothetical protein